MTKITAHANCTHEKTKSARAACRKSRTAIETIVTDYGTFEIKTVKAKDIKKTDFVLYRPQRSNPFFTSVTYDAFQCEDVINGQVVKIDQYRLDLGGPSKYVAGDTEYVVAVDPSAVRDAKQSHTRSLSDKFAV